MAVEIAPDSGNDPSISEARPAVPAKGDEESRQGRASPSVQPPPIGPGMAPRDGEDPYGRGAVDDRFADADDPLNEIPDDTPVDVDSVFKDSRIEEVLDEMDRDLIALKEVKDRIREIAALLLVDRLRRSLALEAQPPTLHMSFTGNPGTGKPRSPAGWDGSSTS